MGLTFAFIIIGFIAGNKGLKFINSPASWINASLHCKNEGKDLACVTHNAMDLLLDYPIEHAWVDTFLTFSSWIKKHEDCYNLSLFTGLLLPKKYEVGTCQLMCRNERYFSVNDGMCICMDNIALVDKVDCSIKMAANMYEKGFDGGTPNCLNFDDVILGVHETNSKEITCGLYSVKGYMDYFGKEHLLIDLVDRTLRRTIGRMSVTNLDGGLIIGIIFGLILLVTVSVLLFVLWKRQFKKRRDNPYEVPFSNNAAFVAVYENQSQEETSAYESLQTERMPCAIYVNTTLQT